MATCYAAVTTSPPVNQQCGALTADRLYVGNRVPTYAAQQERGMLDAYSYFQLNSSQQQSARRIATLTSQTDINFNFVPQLFTTVATQNLNAVTSLSLSSGSIIWLNNFNLGISGNLSCGTPNPGPSAPIGSQAIVSGSYGFAANWTGTWQSARVFVPRIAAASGALGTVVNWEPFFVEPQSNLLNSVNITNWRPFRCGAGSTGTVNSATGTCFSTTERTGATNNAAYHIDSNSATCGAGLVAGTAFDTCLYRAAANVWTFNSDTSLRVPRYVCAGCTSAPLNTVAGDITGARITLGTDTAITDAARVFGLATTVVNNPSSGLSRVGLYTAIFDPANTISSAYTMRVFSTVASTASTNTRFLSSTIVDAQVSQITHSAPAPLAAMYSYRGFLGTGSTFVSPNVVTDAIVFESNGFSSAGNGIIATFTHYKVNNVLPSATVITNQYGFDCPALSSASTNNVCFRGAAPTAGTNRAVIQLSDTGGTTAGGIAFGSFEFFLYRSAADQLTLSGASSRFNAAQVFQNGNQVIDTLTAGSGITITGSGNSRTVSASSSSSPTVSVAITGGGSCGGSVSVLGSFVNMRITLTTGASGCGAPGGDVFFLSRGSACGGVGVPVCTLTPGDDVSLPLTWAPSGSQTSRTARTPSYGSALSPSSTYHYDVRCGCTSD